MRGVLSYVCDAFMCLMMRLCVGVAADRVCGFRV